MPHRLLTRQLEKLGLDVEGPPDAEAWRRVLETVSRTYTAADRDRYLHERSLAVSSREFKMAFLNNISHEVRTPLTAIIGFAEILREEIGAEHREMIHHIAGSGKRLLGMLNAILDLSMLESDSLKMNPEPFDLVAAVEEKVAAGRAVAAEKGLVLDFVAHRPTLRVWLDRSCVERIIGHLLDNALKFTEQGHVLLVLCAEGSTLRIRVQDTGVGIDPAFQPRLFEAFTQESAGLARSHAGTGLGLAVTKKMVELLGGSIAFASEKGQGSVFEVSIPHAVMGPSENGNGLERPEAAAAHRRLHVLVVEDSPDVRLILRYMLGSGYHLVTSSDEATALKHAREQAFDLILMDINLGRQRTGEDVLQALREIPGYAAVPAVAMTAYALPEDRRRFLEAGFDGYLSKPFTWSQLQQVVCQMLEPSGAAPVERGRRRLALARR